MSPSLLRQVTNPALISSDISHVTASDEVKSSMLPFSSPMANIRLSETVSTSYFGDTGYDELIRRMRRRERNGSSSLGELEVCHGCPFGDVSIERLPYLDLFSWVRVISRPCRALE